jgi:hypothetical protein
MAHDDQLTETRRDRRIRDRRRIMAQLRHRHARIEVVFRGTPMSAGSGLYLYGRAADEWYARHYYSARRQCRGPCCGAARRFWNTMTVQEERAYRDALEQLGELGLRHKPSRFSKAF